MQKAERVAYALMVLGLFIVGVAGGMRIGLWILTLGGNS